MIPLIKSKQRERTSEIYRKVVQTYRSVLMLIFVACIMLITPTGCSKATQKTSSQFEDEELFTRGEKFFKKEKYTPALEDFKTLKEQYPKSKYLGKTQFYIGEIHFQRKEYEEALVAFQNLINFYPTHPQVPEAQYKVGLCYYKQMLSRDRDQTTTRQAIEAFERVRVKYPDSEYAQKAAEKFQKCRNRLAEHELVIAEFYLKDKAYQASINRLRIILETYADTEVIDRTLFYLGMNYLKLGQKEEAELYLKRLIQNYPNNSYAEKAKRELSNI